MVSQSGSLSIAIFLFGQFLCNVAYPRSGNFAARKALFSMKLLNDEDIYDIDVAEVHPRTVDFAVKHCQTFSLYASKNIFAEHTKVAFQEACEFVDNFYSNRSESKNDQPKYVILDSGCGVGLSTYCLAKMHPDLPVIGIDRSVVRLSKNKKVPLRNIRDPSRDIAVQTDGLEILVDASPSTEGAHHSNRDLATREDPTTTTTTSREDVFDNRDDSTTIKPTLVTKLSIRDSTSSASSSPPNCILLRAELSDFFLLVTQESDWSIHSHYILYPNPYPKSKHLSRRWHGHQSFPLILAMGGKVVLRSNWEVYCKEMVLAVKGVLDSNSIPGLTCAISEEQLSSDPRIGRDVTTHFERKYTQAGQSLFQASFDLGVRSKEQRQNLLQAIPQGRSYGNDHDDYDASSEL